MSAPLIVLKPDDAARLAALHHAATGDAWPVHEYRNTLQHGANLGLGICDEETDALSAFILCQIALDTADLLMVATHPGFQRRGLARTLLRALLKRLGERGTDRLTLDVASDNSAAIALYRTMGFAEDGRRPSYYKRETGRIDAVLMSRPVTGLPPREKA